MKNELRAAASKKDPKSEESKKTEPVSSNSKDIHSPLVGGMQVTDSQVAEMNQQALIEQLDGEL